MELQKMLNNLILQGLKDHDLAGVRILCNASGRLEGNTSGPSEVAEWDKKRTQVLLSRCPTCGTYVAICQCQFR